MTPNQARKAIYNALIAAWPTSATPTVPYCFDADPFVPATNQTVWFRLAVRHSVRTQDTLGQVTNRKFLTRGNIFVQVFSLPTIGLLDSDAVIQELRSIFEAVDISGVKCFAASDRESGVGSGKDSKWYQRVLTVPFWYEEKK